MPRYIDAENKEALEKCANQYPMVSCALNAYFPTEDVAPIVHAHWETIYNDCGNYGFEKCSACGDEYGSLTYRYCPNCGAKMDEENKVNEN